MTFRIRFELKDIYARGEIFELDNQLNILLAAFLQNDVFSSLSVFDSPEGSSNTLKAGKNISLYFKRMHPLIHDYFKGLKS